MLKKFMIERNIEGVGGFPPGDLGNASKTSNAALAKLEGIQWQYSFVTANKTFCIYFAESEELIAKHAELSGFPANIITEITGMIDPGTENQCPMVTAAE
jgi:Nickel responsive protein SCO4226-like